MERLIKVCFELLGTEMSPKEISQTTGVSPSIELYRGERDESRVLPRQNIWALDSQSDSGEVAEHWEELKPLLNRARDLIKEIAKSGTARLTIVVESQHRLPSVVIPAAMAEFAGFVGAVIDIDHMQ